MISILIALPANAEKKERHKNQHGKHHVKVEQHQAAHHAKKSHHNHKQHQTKPSHHNKHGSHGNHRKHGHHGKHYDYAKVIHTHPVYREVNRPRQECWQESVTVPSRHHSATGTIAGGIIGGVVGHQFGGGHGRDVLTVAGAVLGASIGHDADHKRGTHHTSVQQSVKHCERRDNYIDELQGYKVKYRYHGEIYHRFLDYDPGSEIRIRIDMASTHGYHY